MVKAQELGSRAESVYDRLVEIGKKNGSEDFPAEMIKKILGFCGNDMDLQEYVIEVAPELCMDSNFSLRTDDTIKAKIAAIKETFEERGRRADRNGRGWRYGRHGNREGRSGVQGAFAQHCQGVGIRQNAGLHITGTN